MRSTMPYRKGNVSIIYTPRNQYRVILELDPTQQTDPTDLNRIYVPGANGSQTPLSAVAHFTTTLAPLVTNHQGQFPAVTITYNLKPNSVVQHGNDAILAAVAVMRLPDSLQRRIRRRCEKLVASAGAQAVLVVAALVAVYIVLGIPL